eukprot:7207307-Prymnesium_polylepis.1
MRPWGVVYGIAPYRRITSRKAVLESRDLTGHATAVSPPTARRARRARGAQLSRTPAGTTNARGR